jgi:hypothetical protein
MRRGVTRARSALDGDLDVTPAAPARCTGSTYSVVSGAKVSRIRTTPFTRGGGAAARGMGVARVRH